VQWKSRAAVGFESSRAFCHDGTMGFIFQKLHLFKEKQLETTICFTFKLFHSSQVGPFSPGFLPQKFAKQ